MEVYNKSKEKLFQEFSSSENGISCVEAKSRLDKYGFNEINTNKKDSPILLFLRQFKSFIVWILLLTATISYTIGHFVEFVVILVIILFIILLNFFMEFRAAKEMDSLIKLAPKKTKVLRDGKASIIESKYLVPGDIVILERGYVVGADARLIDVSDLSVDESALTGESVPIHKDDSELEGKIDLSQRTNMVFSGTPVTSGKAVGIVVATGSMTEFGKIGSLIGDVETQKTPLQKRLDNLSRQIALMAFVTASIAFAIGLYHGVNWLEMMIFSMAIIVSGIPESLPTAVGVCLAFGVKKMSRENAIIKSLPAVETLGTCTVICTDKTGTLTQNKMVVEKIFTSDIEIQINGEGYSPNGVFLKDKEQVNVKDHSTVYRAIEIGILCNNASLNREDEEWLVDGEPTEGALVTMGHKAGMYKIEYDKKYKRVKEHSFDPNRKLMSIIHTYKGKDIVHTKGAPEFVLKRAKHYLEQGEIKKLSSKKLERFMKKSDDYASKGFRVLAIAYKEHDGAIKINDIENNLVFVGLLAIRDSPDPLAFDAIKRCKDAGIRPIMITGDSKITAKAIGEEIGIYNPELDSVLTGEELDSIMSKADEKELLKVLNSVTIFARTTPEHKLMIVESLQKKGHVVAMTGDGVNDAPALKKADIGIAMGLRGSEVAKESSNLILKDDKFSTIVKAVESGRNIFSNIRKFIYYLLAGSITEIVLILLAVIVDINLPLTALMILFINLVTSEFPAIGLSLEKSNPSIMKKKPRDPHEGILSDFMILRIFGTVPVMVLGTLSLYIWELFKTGDVAKAQTITFVTIIFFELFHTYNTKSWNRSIFSKDIFSNKVLNFGVLLSMVLTFVLVYTPVLQTIFGTVPLELFDWIVILIVSSSIIGFIELKKYSINVEMNERKRQEIVSKA